MDSPHNTKVTAAADPLVHNSVSWTSIIEWWWNGLTCRIPVTQSVSRAWPIMQKVASITGQYYSLMNFYYAACVRGEDW